MKVTLQKGIDPQTQETIWLVLDEEYQIVEPIQRYLTYLCGSRSPNTVESYGYDLKAWWEFLGHKHLDWHNVQLSDLEDFAYWLRVGDTSSVVSMQPVEAKKSERSINRAITAITGFYEYHIANRTIDFQQFDRFYMPYGLAKKGLLTGIAKSKATRQKLIKLKEPKKFPGCLTNDQIEALVNACNRLRDKLIILMLNGTGMRKGELLGLCHEDIGDFDDHSIRVVQRLNPNGARVKGQERVIPVTLELLQMYNDYLIKEYPAVESDYVFVNIWEGDVGAPMKPKVLNTMFRRLAKKTGTEVYPHLFRHTYATRLLKANYPPERVKYLLGHTSIQTTLDIYSHVITEAELMAIID
ncbi:tyrosine-type recombinase/integrase [Gloeocapsopsis crepidinum LEGE 06123]|uniref:Tyrosine-type recombinase/integrase n=1 Tax=Gloeocapsopsis crepidinum LEGE 06123 TaxID=588587 RepID=A0ABR9UYF0_9CHRO|nr:tyrosine-type recombinase/integrase [Gloeocapsopsis crepidinum]MBE9193354.1 tyrosine-type recombinase/integrase [Gloeocapsopsis crepidinum LEGE 06123]